jgi:hypothetical protein
MLLLGCGCVSLSSASLAEPQCYSNDRYHVVMQPYPDDAGNQFAVTRLKGAAPSTCAFDEVKADLVIGKVGDPLWYSELSGDSLILSRSTGPQGDLVVYDLISGKPVLDVPADEYELKGNSLSFWERNAQASADNCPDFSEHQANGLGSVTAMRKTFDLGSKAIVETGESKCVAVQ